MPKSQRKITPGLYNVGDSVRPVHDGEYRLYGHGKIVAINAKRHNPYQIKFPRATVTLSYREDEITK